jgi:general transcription factor 3C polypeptide 3 (transcription factor C subunit 4)
MVLLSLATGYVHHLTKRQSDNRHVLVNIGLSFLFRYHKVRQASVNALERQEGEFNVARTLHFLGLVGHALPYYERCLALSHEVQMLEAKDERAQDFAPDAAIALRGIYTQAGKPEAAHEVTEKWLQL